MVIHFPNVIAGLFRLTRRITFFRAMNLIGIYAGFYYSKFKGKAHVWAHPFSVSAETAAICNLKCPECIAGLGQTLRSTPLMDHSLFETILREHARHSFFTNLYFQGEPFLNPRLPQMIRVASSAGYYTSLSTNGHFLDEQRCDAVVEAKLDHIIISLDGLSQETYTVYRIGGQFNKVVSGIRTLVAARKKKGVRHPLIEIQFLVNRHNYSEKAGLENFCRELGADVVKLKSMQVYGQKGAKAFLPEDQKYNRYQSGGKSFKKEPCFRLWSHAVYTSDGLAVPCCYDKVPEYPMGDARQTKAGALWFSPRMNAFRQQVLDARESMAICCNCGE